MANMLRNFPVVAPQDVFVLPQSAETMHRCCSSILIAAAEANRFQCRENALYTTTARILQGQHLEEPMTVPCDSRLPSLVEPHGLIAASLRSIRQVQLRRAFHQVEVLNASLSRNKIVEADSLETSTTCGTKTKDAAKHFNTLAQCQQAVQSYQVLVSPPICHLQKQTMKDKSGEIRGVIDSSPSVPSTESDSMVTVKDNVTNSRSANSSQKTLKMLGLTCLERRAAKIPYFDASVLEDPDCRQIKQYSRHHRDCAAIPFPEKLYRMLMEVAQEGKEDIISFFAHGRAFVIHKPDRFAREIMPIHFKHTRSSSFQRQLNLYGFTRINTGPSTGGYYHELFLRGRPAFCTYIRRVGAAKNGSTPRVRGVKPHNAVVDPDFECIPRIRVPCGDAGV